MTQEKTKQCAACGRELPLGAFGWKKQKDGKRNYNKKCRECVAAAKKRAWARKKKDPEEVPLVRPYTPTTDMLVVLFADEDGMGAAEVARELRRDPVDFRRYFEEFVSSGRMEQVRRRLSVSSTVYAARVARKQKRAAL